MKTTTIPLIIGMLISNSLHAQSQSSGSEPIELPLLNPSLTSESLDTNTIDISIDATNDLLDPQLNTINLDDLLEPTTTSIENNQIPYSNTQIKLLLQNPATPVQWQGINNKLRSPQEVKQLYAKMSYQPLWTENALVSTLASSMINSSSKAWTHALKPETYHSQATSSLKLGQTVVESEKFDILLTDAFVTLKKHLANGIVNPKDQFSTWNQKPEQLNFHALYQQASDDNTVDNILTVNNIDYKTLQSAYLVEKSGNKPIPKVANIPAKRLKPGQKNESIIVLREFLGLPIDSNHYDQTVRNAVKEYQLNHGLGADGIAGKKTIAYMNGEAQYTNHTEKLAMNMERLRWQEPTPQGNYVWVNIPAYKMAIRNGHDYLFESNVIVGRKQRQTPVFSDTLEHVVLAPYWNVPKTIFKEDKLPKLQKNPHALGKNMQVIHSASGKVVNSSTVNWQDGGAGYRLRQLPGPRNSLGRMKFLFPNKHAIYLHDTPNRKLFKRNRRAFSSGCVRVERADDLSVFLLKNIGYNSDRIAKESRRNKEKWLTLKNDLRYPVYLDYYTAWADKTGNVRYSQDIYGYDNSLMTMYQSALKNL